MPIVTQCQFTRAVMAGARLTGAKADSAVFLGTDLSQADFRGASLERAIFSQSTLSGRQVRRRRDDPGGARAGVRGPNRVSERGSRLRQREGSGLSRRGLSRCQGLSLRPARRRGPTRPTGTPAPGGVVCPTTPRGKSRKCTTRLPSIDEPVRALEAGRIAIADTVHPTSPAAASAKGAVG